MKSKPESSCYGVLMSLALAAGAVLAAQADNFRNLIVAAGADPVAGYDKLNNVAMAPKAFDGETSAGTDANRCLGESGMYVTMGLPASVVPDGRKVAVTRYRVYQLNGGTSAHARAPRSWKVSGSNDNSTFTDFDKRTGVEWYADTHTIGGDAKLPEGVENWHEYRLDPSVTTDWRYLKFTPTGSKAWSPWFYVFEEIEFYGTVYDPAQGYCEIQLPNAQVGDVYPNYGAVLPTGGVFRVASREAVYRDTPYTLTGWQLEKWQNGNWEVVDSGTEDAYTYVPDGSICRFSWLWQIGDCQLTANVARDVGRETVTCSPPSEMGDGKYASGTVVTLTAHPSEAPYASSFVRWEGDVPEGADASSPVLTVTMDGSRTVTAVFDRPDWPWAFTSDGTSDSSGTLTDGRWNFRVRATTEDGFAGGELAEIIFGDGYLDLENVKAESGLVLLSITNNLFKDNKTITGVAFNDELRRTGSYSFSDSTVKSVRFGTDLRYFGDRTFNASSLTGVVDMTVCTNVTTFANDVFFSSPSIEEIVLPPRVRTFGWRAMANIASLRAVRCSVPQGPYFSEMKKTNLSMDDDLVGGSPLLETVELPCGGKVVLKGMRGLPKFRKLVINGKAPSSVGELFTKYSTTSPQPAYQLQIVVSPTRDRAGWEALKTRAPTAEEKLRDDYPGPNTFGVLDAPEAARAWLVWGRSMFDGGLVLIFK